MFVALLASVGTAAAGSAITGSDVKNSSLTGSDVKNSSLTGDDVKNASLTGSDIKDKSLKPDDFSGSVQGPPGLQGPAGPSGAQGPSGMQNATEVVGNTAFLPDGGVASSTAQCPPGMIVLGGGWDGVNAPPVAATVSYNKPYGGTSWGVIMVDNGGGGSTFRAVATCAPGSNAAIASASAAANRSSIADDLATLQTRK
ncbi:MAG TPA: hypothetical protein VGM91_04180 [Conexibacter sp.]